MNVLRPLLYAVAIGIVFAVPSEATEWFVAQGGNGSGTSAAPFGRIQVALNAAQPGDTITVRQGSYAEAIQTVRHGTSAAPIRLRAEGARGSVLITVKGKVLRVDHAYFVVEKLVIDGQYGLADAVDINSGANYLVLRDLEVRRSTYDLIDIAAPQGVTIENCLIHHALNAANGRTDAHGIVAGAVRDLTIRNTEIHTFSGDGLQLDPSRAAPGWNRVTVEGSRIWLAPLPAPENGFAAGAVAGENAIDTKAAVNLPRSSMVIRDVTAWGFRAGLIGNMAAFNLKENVDVTVDRTTVYDSEIAFRLRGPTSTTPAGAWVTVKNAVVYSVTTGIRYENNIEQLRIWNTTLGGNITRAFQSASSSASGLDVRNLLVLGSKPAEAGGSSNLSVPAAAFVNAASNNYQLAVGSPAIDAGDALTEVTVDRAGVARPQGFGYDIGAFEHVGARAGEVVTYAWRARAVGNWHVAADESAAGGLSLVNPNQKVPKLSQARATPADYFETSVTVTAGTPYHLWIRGRAEGNGNSNDAVFVQFSASVRTTGTPIYRIGTTSALTVNVEDCSGCGLSGWGWQDNGYGRNVLGAPLLFDVTGTVTLRVQPCEDGLSIDQIVLSPSAYLSVSPGLLQDDTTILPES